MRFAGIDVGKKKHAIAVLDEQCQVLVKPRTFSENAGGYETALRLLGASADVHVVMEATGHYWHNLFARLTGEGYTVTVVNPLVTSRFARMELRRAKTDEVDALGLARFGLMMRPESTPVPDQALEDIKGLVRWRSRVVQDLSDKMRELQAFLDRSFPEVTEVFQCLQSRRSTYILRKYPSAERFAKISPSSLVRLKCQGRRVLNLKTASRLIELARSSVGHHSLTVETAVPALCDDIAALKARISDLDKQLGGLVADCELGALFLSIPGVGPVSTAQILGEVGDPSRFPTPGKLAAYVGVVPGISTSGKRQPERAGICRVGNARLRSALWMPTLVAVEKNPWLKPFYQGLVARGKKPKIALIASMRKLLTLIWRLATDRRPFEYRPKPVEARIG